LLVGARSRRDNLRSLAARGKRSERGYPVDGKQLAPILVLIRDNPLPAVPRRDNRIFLARRRRPSGVSSALATHPRPPEDIFFGRVGRINGYYVDGGEAGRVVLAKTGREINARRARNFFPARNAPGIRAAGGRHVAVDLFAMYIKFWPSRRTHATRGNCLGGIAV
jgi:hypothetical protein